ncbi:MAG: hypothetical protein ISR52_02190 [Rhodospirillales bacterium]|nr:hypothetical protein [Rhodospirillales bacterium]
MHAPVIIIHTIDHARTALAAAAEQGCKVVLHSAPGAVAYLGATVFRDLVTEAAKEHPGVEYLAVLDCGDEPGLAMGAMRHGIEAVRLHARPEIQDKLADIATQRGVIVFDHDGPVLDLLDMADPLAACRAWLRPLD